MSRLESVNLRVSHYLEDKTSPGRVGVIVCFRGDGLIAVHPGKMDHNSRTNEWNFGDPPIDPSEGIWITATYLRGYIHEYLYFERFRPDLRHSKERLSWLWEPYSP